MVLGAREIPWGREEFRTQRTQNNRRRAIIFGRIIRGARRSGGISGRNIWFCVLGVRGHRYRHRESAKHFAWALGGRVEIRLGRARTSSLQAKNWYPGRTNKSAADGNISATRKAGGKNGGLISGSNERKKGAGFRTVPHHLLSQSFYAFQYPFVSLAVFPS